MEPGPPLDGDTLLRHADGVRRLARSLVRDEHRSEDVAQETLARAVERPPRTGWPLRAWLAGVARHVALTSARGERRRADRERAAARPEAVPSAAEAVSRVAEQRRVLDAVLGLDEPLRTVVVLRFFEGLPPRAIALRLGVPVEIVYARLKRALSNLRQRLDSEHGGDSRRCSFALLAVAQGGPATWLVVPGLGAIVVKKAVVLAVLLLGIGLVGWRLVASTERSPGADSGAPAQIEGSGSAHLAAAQRAAPGESAALLGPTIDFATVDRDLDLHGTIVKEDGSPVAGAEVSCLSYPARRTNLYFTGQWFHAVAGPSTRSASDGTFKVRLRRGERVDLRVSAAGAATQERPDCLAGERVRIVMSPAAALVVLVRDQDGAPVGGTRLRLVRLPSRGDVTFVRTAETGADGRARFGDLPGPTQASLKVIPATLGSPSPIEVRVPRAAEAQVEVTLPVGRTITGRVTDAATRVPVSGAIVGMGWPQDRAVPTDAEGRYTLLGWTGEDESEIHALADGYGREGFVLGAASTHDFALEAGDSVAGRVVDVGGAPVPEAWVLAAGGVYEPGAPRRDSYRWGTATADGRFRLDGLRRDLPHTLIVLATGYGKTLLDFDPRPKAAGLVELGDVVLAAPRRIEGRVLDSAGSGVPRVAVTLRGANADRSRLRPGQPPVGSGYGARDIAFPDDLGRFRFADLSPGAYTLTARPTGEPEAMADVVVPSQKDALGVEIHLAEGRRIRVTVVDAAGAPVPGVLVIASASRGFQLEAMTGPDGVASLLAAGTSLSVAVAQPRSTATRYIIPKHTEVLAGAAEARIVLVEGAVVAGRVLDPAGAPLAGTYIDARKEGRTVGGAWADAQGHFEVVVPAAGAVDLSLSGRLSRPGGAGVVPTPLFGSAAGITPGTTDVVIRATLPATDRRMRLVVLDPDGTPAKGVRLMVGPEWSGNAVGSSVTSEDGTFELENLPARPLTMTVGAMPDSKGWNHWLWQPVGPVVPEGQTVTVRLVEGVPIAGVVLRPDGTPAAGAIVRSFRDGDARHMTNADADGRFSLLVHRANDLPLGLRAQDPLDLMVEATQEGVGEATGEVTLRLVRLK